ncbi:cytochrome P450 [Pseudonocardia sp. GCM10023141]|uniref:cytochrome P450 n=1 Tax=Pseudonocardia sp. GCM10023141 TaxID=3252653 RepID=UPI003620E9C0
MSGTVDVSGPDQLLTSWAEVHEALQRDDVLVQASYDEAKPDIFGGALLTLDGAEHRARRRIEQRLFRPPVVRAYDRDVLPGIVAMELAELGDRAFDLVTVGRRITTRVATAVVGVDDCTSRERVERLAELMTALHAGVVVRWSARPHAEVLAEARAAKVAFRDEFLAASLERRRAGGPGAGRPLDLLELLVAHADELGWTDEQYLTEALHYLIAAAHTASNGLTHAVADLEGWLAAHPEDRQRVADPDFVARCAAETLRLHAPTATAFRGVVADVTLESGRALHRGELVGLDLLSASRDPAVYGEGADRFDPWRATGNASQAFGLSFSSGAHNCPGRQLAAGSGPVRDRAGETVQGMLARIVTALYAAGLRTAGAPTLNPDSLRAQYATYPVVLTRPVAPAARP